jgi:hypothetical protein
MPRPKSSRRKDYCEQGKPITVADQHSVTPKRFAKNTSASEDRHTGVQEQATKQLLPSSPHGDSDFLRRSRAQRRQVLN